MKNLPFACTKTQLINKLKPISESDVMKAIYKVIMKNRKYNITKAKNVRGLFKNEVKEVLVALGELEPNEHDLSNVA